MKAAYLCPVLEITDHVDNKKRRERNRGVFFNSSSIKSNLIFGAAFEQ